MTTKSERRVGSEPGGAEDRYEDLRERYDFLRANAEEVIRENKALRNQTAPSARSTAGVFLILVAFIVAGRLALYFFVENAGTGAHAIASLSDILFAAGSALLLYAWVRAEWAEVAWLAVPKFVIVFVTLLICASVFNDGALLRGDWSASPTHPILASVIAIVALSLAASPLAIVAVSSILRLLNGVSGGQGGE
jgi:hypothetical protein